MSLINREDLIAEYDRVHVGEPGGARKLMVDAPEVQQDRMKLVQQAVNTIMSTSRSYSIRDRAFRNAARLVQCAIDGEAPDFEQIPEGDEMPSEPHWIPVSERLPEENGFYLVTVNAQIRPVRIYGYAPWEMDEERKYWLSDCDDHSHVFNHFVKAWMPLPESYSGE